MKTEERRQAIMNAAAEVFWEMGYERASMTQICARGGGSKATLYGYFKSKEELFAAVMQDAMEAQAEGALALLDEDAEDVEDALRRFAHAIVDLALAPNIVAVMRVGIAEGENSGLGRTLYDIGPKTLTERLAVFLRSHMRAGRLRAADPWIAALHLRGLLDAGLVEPSLFGAEVVVDRADAPEQAVQAFLKAYGAEAGANGSMAGQSTGRSSEA